MIAMEWEETMINPEKIQLIKQYNWKHTSWLNTLIDITRMCDNERVSLFKISSPEDGVETQLVCTTCGRTLTIYGKEN